MNRKFEFNKKQAFTMVEAVMCFVVMGAVFAATISQIKISNKYDKLYYAAFDTLFQAAKNASNEYRPKCQCDETNGKVMNCEVCVCWSVDCWNIRMKVQSTQEEYKLESLHKGGTPHGRNWPGFLYGHSEIGDYDGTGTDKAFCELLTQKINTLYPNGQCRSFISGINEENVQIGDSKGVNFFNAFCSSPDKEEPCVGFEIEPTFIAANGQRFYISSVLTANLSGVITEKNESYVRSSYRLVAVDLNGSAGPNSQFKVGNKNPDIVLFAINSIGDVIPLGYPEFSKEYIKAIIQYPEYTNEIDPNDPTKFKKNDELESMPYTLYDAKKYAWGPPIGSVAGVVYGQAYSLNEPLSYSTLLYSVANKCIDKNCENKSDEKSLYVDNLFSHLIMQFLYTTEGKNDIPSQLLESADLGIEKEKGCKTGDSSYCSIIFSKI